MDRQVKKNYMKPMVVMSIYPPISIKERFEELKRFWWSR